MKVKTKYISPSAGYFEINNGNSVYRLMEKMTSSVTQDKFAEFYEIEKKKGNPIPMNSIQHIEVFNDAVKSGNSDLLNFLQKGLQKGPTILTRVIYNSRGEKDVIIHNYGTSDSYLIVEDIVGEDNWISEIKNRNVLESLLKTKDVKILNEISNTLNKTPIYLLRLNSKPSEKVERVIRFSASSGRFFLDACGYPSGEGAAFLVQGLNNI